MRWAALALVGPLALGACRPTSLGARDARVEVVGFVERAQDGWWLEHSGSEVRFAFRGSSHVQLRFTQEPRMPEEGGVRPPDRLSVFLDGERVSDLFTRDGKGILTKTRLDKGPHTVTVRKETEAMVGRVRVAPVALAQDAEILAVPQRAHRLELIGDSLTTGYGNEGETADCPYSPETQRFSTAWGGLLGDRLDADVAVVAWSGRGVVENYGGLTDFTVPELYEKAERLRPPAWTPEVVIINLGTNDFWETPPPPDAFRDTYVALATRVLAEYPDAHLVLALGPTINDNWPKGIDALTTARAHLQEILARLKSAGHADRVHFVEHPHRDRDKEGAGCAYHPSLKTHERQARELEAVLRPLLAAQ